MAYGFRDYYNNKRPSKTVPANPSFATMGQWPMNQLGSMGPQSDDMPLMFGGKPGMQNFQNSFGKPGYNGSMGSQAPATMPPPTFNPQPQRKNYYTGMPSFGNQNGASSDPFAFLMNAMGGGMMGGMTPPGVTKVPQGIDPQQYMKMTPEQRWQISQAGPSPGEGYSLVRQPIYGGGGVSPGAQWKWQMMPQFANF